MASRKFMGYDWAVSDIVDRDVSKVQAWNRNWHGVLAQTKDKISVLGRDGHDLQSFDSLFNSQSMQQNSRPGVRVRRRSVRRPVR